MIQLIIAVKDLIKSVGARVDVITKVGTYPNIKDIKLSNDKQIANITYNAIGIDFNISCKVKDIDYIGVYTNG